MKWIVAWLVLAVVILAFHVASLEGKVKAIVDSWPPQKSTVLTVTITNTIERVIERDQNPWRGIPMPIPLTTNWGNCATGTLILVDSQCKLEVSK